MIVFFGSSEYSVAALKSLLTAGLKVAVVTTPDRPVGRRQILTPNPLAEFSQKKGIATFKIDQWDWEKIPQDLRGLIEEAQVGVCCVYGKIIPEFLIKKFEQGILNIHPSLLPKYRGASPAVGIILNEEKVTGFSFIQVDEKVDHGPIVFQEQFPISNQITAADLYRQTFQKAADKLPKILIQYQQGLLKPKPQDDQKASFTPRLKRDDGYIEVNLLKKALEKEKVSFVNLPELAKKIIFYPKKEYQAAKIVFDLYRSLYPWPGIWTIIEVSGKARRLKILRIHFKEGRLAIDQVQLEGKNPVSWQESGLKSSLLGYKG